MVVWTQSFSSVIKNDVFVDTFTFRQMGESLKANIEKKPSESKCKDVWEADYVKYGQQL